jgi:hypothetical protein
MKNLAIVGAVGCAFVLIVSMICAATFIGTFNSEISTRADFNAQLKVNESSFDKTWKIIQQEAQVASTERESFRKTYSEIMQSQQGIAGNGQLASFFTQANINISPDLFAKLMTSIEAQRESFHRDQMKLAEIKSNHDKIIGGFPGNMLFFFIRRDPLELKIITSDRTNEAFTSGTDNDVDLNLK